MKPFKNLLHPCSLQSHQHHRHHHHHHQVVPTDLVHRVHDHLLSFHISNNLKDLNHQKISKLLQELHFVLHGDSEAEPDSKVCSKTALEFFKDKRSATNPFRLLLKCFASLEWESQIIASQIVVNLMGQHLPFSSRIFATEYIEENLDLPDFLIDNMFDLVDDNSHLALLYGIMLRECVLRSQIATKHVLDSQYYMKKFLEYVPLQNYTFAGHVADTLGFLLTRHKSLAADFLNRNYEWFFEGFNSKLLESSNQLTKSHALMLLGNMLLEGKNRCVMVRYVSDFENLKLLMNALRESKSTTQLKAFHVFKLFVLNSEKPKGVVDILRLNKTKLLQFMDGLKPSRQDQQFDQDKALVIREIMLLSKQDNCNPLSLPGQLRRLKSF
ncbi:putative MO25-like protein At4g17270 [Gastrolobium bilobum]|uniref:putative MO25-like protein At4g17270 n=1 Tax=Gastrolobium bilobum TaxID=150636 RepID=UPI002AB03559|nr:putative MO25-like protein At4g17270 [Gastrolobium bilobum]XP_061365302.1 putative MO25-like protein At4g17270 [Gastrolobium bilobum]